jgi:hypothetical protein
MYVFSLFSVPSKKFPSQCRGVRVQEPSGVLSMNCNYPVRAAILFSIAAVMYVDVLICT